MKAIPSAYALSEYREFHPMWKCSANPEKVTEKTKLQIKVKHARKRIRCI